MSSQAQNAAGAPIRKSRRFGAPRRDLLVGNVLVIDPGAVFPRGDLVAIEATSLATFFARDQRRLFIRGGSPASAVSAALVAAPVERVVAVRRVRFLKESRRYVSGTETIITIDFKFTRL